MKRLAVYLEMQGQFRSVGFITGENFRDASFQYSEDYLKADYARPISISLPLTDEAFTSERTRNFFEGLLPEGFSRRAVANWIKTDEEDYLTILSKLGRECLGAVKILEESDTQAIRKSG